MRNPELSHKVLVAAMLALSVAASPRSAEASGMTSSIEFSTSGTIGSTGMIGPQVVSYRGTADGTLSTNIPIGSLGEFVVQPVPAGQTTTYNRTPFDIVVALKSVNGIPATAPAPIEIKGWLYGTVSGEGSSNLGYILNYAPPLYPSIVAPFQIGNTLYRLDQVDLVDGRLRTAQNGAVTEFPAMLNTTEVVPEPTILTMFGASMGLLLLGQSRNILARRGNATSA